MKSTLPLLTQDYSNLIGTPYEKLDCWGVVVSFYQICFGVELKRYYDSPPNDVHKANNLISSNIGDFIPIEDMQDMIFGDILLIYLFGVESHIAVYLGNGKILHTQKKVGCMVDRLCRWKDRVSRVGRLRIG